MKLHFQRTVGPWCVIGTGEDLKVREKKISKVHNISTSTPVLDCERFDFIYLQPAPTQPTQEGVRPSTGRRGNIKPDKTAQRKNLVDILGGSEPRVTLLQIFVATWWQVTSGYFFPR
ncbi:hypothetical protein AVEN_45995-1 [Araneus ventricosus]|uniref:Uncharacterized protein n=1 Tax=Araneus ventricosus TaxID=182803 RepID=A0A4Y2F509_ARAVE|nr:hypothetical protein AVEN_45995-1 [Araneus ventricosus]